MTDKDRKMKRTIYCGAVRNNNVDEEITVCGWVNTRRDMGGVIFIDLCDREGLLQVVFNANNLSTRNFNKVERFHNQSVIAVRGKVRVRDEETYNPKIATGEVELMAYDVELISDAESLPFVLDDNITIREDLRLKYRFLDLRRPKMFNNLKYRHKVLKAVTNFLDDSGFIQVETPMLTKSTPEGARDYLVPSRIHPGMFYALPQSPQIFKQLLMVGGVDKYYQVARCFRDEDLRADRQPEFTQVDMELSFVDQEDVLVHLEKLFKHIFKEAKGMELEPFERITWQKAMDVYGSDKPDLRYGLPIVDLTEIAKKCSFSVFRKIADEGGVVRAINVKGQADFTRLTIEKLTEKAISEGAKGMAWIAIRPDGEIYSILTKYFTNEEMNEIIKTVKGEAGDFILFCADSLPVVRKTLGAIRTELSKTLGLCSSDDYKFLIITDFPQFEYSKEEKRYLAMHHPFTMPYPEDVEYMMSDPGRVRAQAYDIVLNGIELGSGSIRIHDKNIQQQMFKALGFTPEQIKSRFGFMVDAFKFGTPPHGGFAFGLDRLIMLMVGAESLREVIAFPKTKDAYCLMTDAPDYVDEEQLETLNLMQQGINSSGNKNVEQKKYNPIIDIKNIANLARLEIKEENIDKLKKEMKDVVEFVNLLAEIDTTDVPLFYNTNLKNVFRDDVVVSEFSRDELLEIAVTKDEAYITVPRVVE